MSRDGPSDGGSTESAESLAARVELICGEARSRHIYRDLLERRGSTLCFGATSHARLDMRLTQLGALFALGLGLLALGAIAWIHAGLGALPPWILAGSGLVAIALALRMGFLTVPAPSVEVELDGAAQRVRRVGFDWKPASTVALFVHHSMEDDVFGPRAPPKSPEGGWVVSLDGPLWSFGSRADAERVARALDALMCFEAVLVNPALVADEDSRPS